ncbi:septal ring lytic transglycosylase RlpA family protein [Adhaeribacter soli]|uniref:Probable endolytic peptidoglycan transglycosylase RlpA n=1 Tax=Adhaeribacter soli TaxID=2607655 RepID=A0A5N1J660_9BACT|nr:septal ring lytic transglycosylase RlpA family protein [Adhaeribacter soli]KAA9340073.1 septal ring lytic transglycosylase RlpA family protein [Adhaeribacter soli]
MKFPVFNCLVLIALIFLSSCAANRFTEEGKASYYSDKLAGRKMANGEKYRPGKLTAAHKTLPFGTKVKVTNPKTNRSVKVTITDRGPFAPGRVIDLSRKAARKLDIIDAGVAPVKLKATRRKK